MSYLVSVESEKKLVQKIFDTLLSTRSICRTADVIGETHRTRTGAAFIRDMIKNPIYCTADECAYRYFLERDGNLFGEASDYDGQHGISVYNKTDQLKAEDEDPTFFNPKSSQMSKVIRDGFVLMGEHSYVYGIY